MYMLSQSSGQPQIITPSAFLRVLGDKNSLLQFLNSFMMDGFLLILKVKLS